LAQSSLESQTQQTNIALLTTAVEPLKRSSPRYLLNLLVTLFLGGIMGLSAAVFREIADRRIREPGELVLLSGVPLYATIPGVRPDSRGRRSAPNAAASTELSAI
jgi:capsular polysaccharide biosynthesis protein